MMSTVRWTTPVLAMLGGLGAVSPVAAVGDFQLVLSGECPGEEIVTVASATPNGSVEIYRSAREGSGGVPSGPCEGTETGLDHPTLIGVLTVDADGGAATVVMPPAKTCGQLLQPLDVTTCAVGNVSRVTSGRPAPSTRTGLMQSYAAGDDGQYQKGLAPPNPRFRDNGDGTVTDHLTGLVWLQFANCFDLRTWEEALADANSLADGACGLSDGSAPGDWRLPNVRELASLIDYGVIQPSVPRGHPFIDVLWYPKIHYWTSTRLLLVVPQAWGVLFSVGHIDGLETEVPRRVWPVRDAN